VAIGIISVGLLIFLAHFLSALFEKTRIPDVLPLVFLGLILGPVFGIITPEFFGKLGNVFATISLIIILFQSGLDLNITALRESLVSGVRLTLINFAATILVVLLIAVYLFNLDFFEALILGAILGGTSSAIVVPLVKKLHLKQKFQTALFLESAFSDVLCILVTLGLLQTIKYHELHPGLMLGQIISSFSLAATIGVLSAFFWSSVLHKIRRLENGIFLTPAFVFIVFGVSEFLGYSGAISSLAFGIVIGNIQRFKLPLLKRFISFKPIKFNEVEKTFFAEIVFLLKTFFFIYIGLSIKINNFYIILGSLILTLAVFMIRIPVVHLSMERIASRFDISVISAIVPKGLAAAVLASLPLQAGIVRGGIIQDIIYAVILFSIIFTAILTFLIEKNILRRFYSLVFARYAGEKVSAVVPVECDGEGG